MSEWTLLLLHCLTRLSIEASLSLSVINSIKSLNAIKNIHGEVKRWLKYHPESLVDGLDGRLVGYIEQKMWFVFDVSIWKIKKWLKFYPESLKLWLME
jgi:hypothetical protein